MILVYHRQEPNDTKWRKSIITIFRGPASTRSLASSPYPHRIRPSIARFGFEFRRPRRIRRGEAGFEDVVAKLINAKLLFAFVGAVGDVVVDGFGRFGRIERDRGFQNDLIAVGHRHLI